MLVLALALTGLFSACRNENPPALPELALPDLSNAEAGVTAALKEQHAELSRGDASAYRRYARTLQVHDYLDEAVAAYEVAAERSEDSFEDLYLAGTCLHAKNPVRALGFFARARNERKNYLPLHLACGKLAQDLGDSAAARTNFDRALKLKRTSAALLGRAGIHLAENEIPQALDLAREAQQISARDRDLWALFARAYTKSGDLIRSRKAQAIAKSLSMSTGIADAIQVEIYQEAKSYLALARYAGLLLNADRLVEGQNAIEDALQIRPEEPTGLHILIRIMGRRGQYHSAYDMAEKLLNKDADDHEAAFLKAVMLVDLARPAEALGVVEKIAATKPDHIESRLLMGAILGKARPKLAKAHLRFVIDKDPTKPEPYLYLAQILHREGRKDRAIALLEKFVELAPGDQHVKRLLGQLRRL